MDVIKFLLQLCFALFLLFMGVVCAVAMWRFGASGPPDLPVPTPVRVFQGICGFFALAFAASAVWMGRVARRQWGTREPILAVPEEVTAKELVTKTLSKGEVQDFDLGRLTGAGWFAALVAVVLPFVALTQVPKFFANDRRVQDLIGGGLLVAMALLFCVGYWGLAKLGIRVIKPKKPEPLHQPFEPISPGEIPDPRRKSS